MKFFVPAAKDDKNAEKVYDSIKKFAKETTGWDVADRRIFSITYRHEGKEYHAEVGQADMRVGEVVVAILESTTYLVCTPNRGVVRGGPILVGKDEVFAARDFEE